MWGSVQRLTCQPWVPESRSGSSSLGVALAGGRPCLKCRFVSKINGYCWFEPLGFGMVCFIEPANWSICLLSLRTQVGRKAEGERQWEGRDD